MSPCALPACTCHLLGVDGVCLSACVHRCMCEWGCIVPWVSLHRCLLESGGKPSQGMGVYGMVSIFLPISRSSSLQVNSGVCGGGGAVLHCHWPAWVWRLFCPSGTPEKDYM